MKNDNWIKGDPENPPKPGYYWARYAASSPEPFVVLVGPDGFASQAGSSLSLNPKNYLFYGSSPLQRPDR